MAAAGWPMSDLDVAAALRSQLDELTAKLDRVHREREKVDERNTQLLRAHTELNRQIDDLRRVLVGTAEDLAEEHDPEKQRSRIFWQSAFQASNKTRAELMLRVTTLQRWLREQGEESTRLQTKLLVAENEIGELTRALDLARSGERCDSSEAD